MWTLTDLGCCAGIQIERTEVVRGSRCRGVSGIFGDGAIQVLEVHDVHAFAVLVGRGLELILCWPEELQRALLAGVRRWDVESRVQSVSRHARCGSN